MPTEQFISMEGPSTSRTGPTAGTQAAASKLAAAFERALKINCPINKNYGNRRASGGSLRASIKATAASVSGDVSITVTANDTIKYVLGGTSPHTILPVNASALSFPWNQIQSFGPAFTSPGRSITTRWSPFSGFARAGTMDLRALVRTSGAKSAGSQVAFASVSHPGASANDFVGPSLTMLGPDLDAFGDAVGESMINDLLSSLTISNGNISSRA